MGECAKFADVAVIIPTYNHARFLKAAITSVLSQTVLPREIIVIDDGSTDDPGKVTSEFPAVRLVRQDNRGLAAARNTGLRESVAGHLLFLDADDRLHPTAIEYGMSLLDGDPEAAFAYSAYEIVNAAGPVPVEFRPAPRWAFRAFLVENLIGMHATVVYRRAPLEAVGGFREGLRACEDYDVYLRLTERYPVACGPRVTAEYWHHDGNMSRDAAMMLRSALAVLSLWRDPARRAGALAEHRAGVAQWKSYYSMSWMRAVRGGANLKWLRQGAAIVAVAPFESVKALAHGIRALVRR
jgi:glycosyltransferase involved in cell wall biosynthesis